MKDIPDTSPGPMESFFQQELQFALELVYGIDTELSTIAQHKAWGTLNGRLLDTAKSLLSHEVLHNQATKKGGG